MYGDCYRAAGRRAQADESVTLCHGWPGNLQSGHAWVESTDARGEIWVEDMEHGLYLPKDAYLRFGRINDAETRRYTHEETLVSLLRHRHWGPWGTAPARIKGSRSLGGLPAAQRRRYETGLCAEFAVALHRVYGYPLAMWIEVEREGREWLEGPYVHVVAKHPSGKLLDVGGLSSKAALTRKLLHSPGASLRFRDTTEQELDGFGMEGLDPETLADAEAIVRAYPGYGP